MFDEGDGDACCTEVLIWTPAALWGIPRLPARHVLLLHALPDCRFT
jgi:hypothetical protein